MKTKHEEFEVLVPNVDGTGVAERVKVTVPLKWDEELQEWLLTPEAHETIENTKARHMDLLLPAQFKELRERYGYSQQQMGELFQVGEKSWTRWESGKHRPSRSINLLIRALYEGRLPLNYLLQKAGKPPVQCTAWAQKAFDVLAGPWHPCPDASSKSAADIVCYTKGGQTVFLECKSYAAEPSLLAQLYNLPMHSYEAAKPAEANPRTTKRFAMPVPTHTYPRPSLLPTES
jgi:DNA-binding transcriptional regulator YiaG